MANEFKKNQNWENENKSTSTKHGKQEHTTGKTKEAGHSRSEQERSHGKQQHEKNAKYGKDESSSYKKGNHIDEDYE